MGAQLAVTVGLIESSMNVEGSEEMWPEEVKENFIRKAEETVEQLRTTIDEFLMFGQAYDTDHGDDS